MKGTVRVKRTKFKIVTTYPHKRSEGETYRCNKGTRLCDRSKAGRKS